MLFYEIYEQRIQAVTLENMDHSKKVIGYINIKELQECDGILTLSRELMEEDLYEQPYFHIGIEIKDHFSFGIIQVVSAGCSYRESGRLAFYINTDMLLFVGIYDPCEEFSKRFHTILEKERQNVSLEKISFHIFDSFLEKGSTILEETEQRIISLERHLIEGDIDKNINRNIFELKRKLTLQKNYYQQLCSIGVGLVENENNIFSYDGLKYFKIFTDKAERLNSSTQFLYESLIHLREALDAALDYSLNSIMKVFTVVTTIFMPLTLIAGWYGMNFPNMPEFSWQYGYLTVILISVAVIIGCLLFFRWKKFL
jgi:magnesium transporter